MTCPHTHTTTAGPYPYLGSVAEPPYTDPTRAAHGGVRYEETCSACGASRSILRNQGHEEIGSWRMPETAAPEPAPAPPRPTIRLADRSTLRLDRVDTRGAYLTRTPLTGYPEPVAIGWSTLRAAATQDDPDLAAAYSAVLAAAEAARG